jgi:hypothetical protein
MTGALRGVIRHRVTGEYYAGTGRWSEDAADAVQFIALEEVVAEAQKHGMEGSCEFMVSPPNAPGLSIFLPI